VPSIDVIEAPLDAILEMREAYRREMDCQIVHDSWHARGFTRSYLLQLDGAVVGYGAVGGAPHDPRDTVKEFHVAREHRAEALPLFRRLVDASGARTVEAQTNDVLLSLMLYDCASEVTSETILFEDAVATHLPAPPGMTLRPVTAGDRARAFTHTVEPVGDWGLECEGTLVATGGLAYHYNPPYGDLYMEVAAAHQRRGLGAYLVQELKRLCREGGHVPAARCRHDNLASRRTLERAGMFPCARILHGRLRLPASAEGASPSEPRSGESQRGP
jgi:GNAT superfamily N-acetyltransferase